MAHQSEQQRVAGMMGDMHRARIEERKFRWNPHTKTFETHSSAHEDPEKLIVTPEDLGHS